MNIRKAPIITNPYFGALHLRFSLQYTTTKIKGALHLKINNPKQRTQRNSVPIIFVVTA